MTRAYGEGAELAQVGEGWRPFRSWAAFLLRVDAGLRAGD